MSESERAHCFIDRPIATDQTLNGFAAVFGDRDLKTQNVFALGDVELPTDPDDREALPHEQSVAEVGLFDGIDATTGAVEVS